MAPVMVTLQDDLLKEADGEGITLVLLDLSGAFSTINHSIVLDRLLGMGVERLVLSWLQSFLIGHAQRVQLGEELSGPKIMGCRRGLLIYPMLIYL